MMALPIGARVTSVGTTTKVQWSDRPSWGFTQVMNDHPDRLVEIHDDASGRRVVTKRYIDADGDAIYHDHVALWQSAFGERRLPPGLPQPLLFNPLSGMVTMEHIPGATLAVRGTLGNSLEHTAGAAALLADMHRSGVPLSRRRSTAGVVRSVQRKAASLVVGPSAYQRLADQLVNCAPVDDDVLVASHGDFSPRNVLLTPESQRLTIIDFDRLQLASPARDVAYWGAWIWTTQRLRGEEPSWLPGDQFALAYVSCAPEYAEAVTSHQTFHRAAALARIVHGWSALALRTDVARALIDDAMRLIDERLTNTQSLEAADRSG
jgi:Phosphotransferase enzyme family